VPDRVQIGADVGGTKLLLVALHRDGRESYRVPTGPEAGPELVEREVRALLTRIGAPPAVLGIAVPGLVDADGRVAACDTLPRFVGWRAGESFADLRCQVEIMNDAEAALVEEACTLEPGATSAMVMAGTWIGAAFRVNGAPLRGVCGWAGELGYMPILVGDGTVARLDDLAGGAAIAARLGTDGAGLYELAARGDPEAIAAIRRAGGALGLGLATLVNLLNPDLLVLGGGALQLPGYLEAALDNAGMYSLPELWRVCTVRTALSGQEAVALGAIRATRQAC
jgi:predicted NBD/HSP70 family sugar kinase